jgi:tyrosyl-tRNA synthetase
VSNSALTTASPAIDPTFENVWDELVYYCGFDPTAPSLHLGNLVQL